MPVSAENPCQNANMKVFVSDGGVKLAIIGGLATDGGGLVSRVVLVVVSSKG
jgi:hypothetical protein